MTDRTVIRQAMAMLSNPHRAVIYRAYYLERTVAQIAAEYHTTETVVRAELHDAMKALQCILRQPGPSRRSKFLAYRLV
jgi:RNA polymerase sigma-70 factor, ECF subfamily